MSSLCKSSGVGQFSLAGGEEAEVGRLKKVMWVFVRRYRDGDVDIEPLLYFDFTFRGLIKYVLTIRR